MVLCFVAVVVVDVVVAVVVAAAALFNVCSLGPAKKIKDTTMMITTIITHRNKLFIFNRHYIITHYIM